MRYPLPWLLVATVTAVGVWRAPRSLFLPPLVCCDSQLPLVNDDGPSADLAADVRLMWETGPMNWVSDPAERTKKASTDAAIEAASRVFNTVELDGLTRAEVIARLGDPRRASDSIYNFPFWPAPDDALVYRFDTGAYGWQFTVVFVRGEVNHVERYWIH